jgi:hypothetical protein
MGFVHMQVYRKLGRGPLAGGNWEGSRYGITLLIFHSCLNESTPRFFFSFVFESTFLHQKLEFDPPSKRPSTIRKAPPENLRQAMMGEKH